MRVPAYKKIWTLCRYYRLYLRRVFWRIAANMLHKNLNLLTRENNFFRVFTSYVLPVNIAVYANKRFKIAQLFSYGNSAKIPGMPYFITLPKMLKNGIV